MDNSSRLFKVIQSNEIFNRRERCNQLMKKFESNEILPEKNLPEQAPFASPQSPGEDFENQIVVERLVGDSKTAHNSPKLSNLSVNHIRDAVSSTPQTFITRGDPNDMISPVGMEIENDEPQIGKDGSIQEEHKEILKSVENDKGNPTDALSSASPLTCRNVQRGVNSSSLIERLTVAEEMNQRKKCLEKESRPGDALLTSNRKDSLSSVSNRSSLEPISEEKSIDRSDISEKSYSVEETDELEPVAQPSRERTSLFSSSQPSLEPIQEDLETNEMDTNQSTDENVPTVSVDEPAKEPKRRSSRPDKLSLETIEEEHADAVRNQNLIAEKHPLPFPSVPSDNFSWFDLRSPMIKPSRKRHLDELDDGVSSNSSLDWNSSVKEIALPYNVSDYRQSVYSTIESSEMKNLSFNESPGSYSSPAQTHISGDSDPVQERKNVINDLRSKVSRHEDAIRKISEALHASRGVNANLNEHLVLCHRDLLIERQARQLLLEEIDRLERGSQLSRSHSTSPCGTLVINNISLPLKPSEAQTSTEEPCDEEFIFICLLKCPSGRLVPSDLSSIARHSRRESVDFRIRFSLSQVPSDFVIHLEVYAMTLVRRSISGIASHNSTIIEDDSSITSSIVNVMSSSNANGSGAKRFRFIKRFLTPSKSVKRSTVESSDSYAEDEEDDGWRTTGFSILTSIQLTRDTLSQREFPMGRIPHLYPLSGKLVMRISLNHTEENIEECGFLSVFSHVGGFGAWQRLWCALKSNRILMWRYPDDEGNNIKPIRTIELSQCISERVTLATKDVCYRPQTLVMNMASHSTSEENTPLRLLLSADTKSDRVVWCNKINRCLACLRSWNPSQYEGLRQRYPDT